MGVQQKVFHVEIKTTNPKITKRIISNFLKKSIENSKHKNDFTYKVKEPTYVYDFIEHKEMFTIFLRFKKAEFLDAYGYITEDEYDLTLQEFNKDRMGYLLKFLKETNQKDLVEPYELTCGQFHYAVSYYVKHHFTQEEQDQFDEILNQNHMYL